MILEEIKNKQIKTLSLVQSSFMFKVSETSYFLDFTAEEINLLLFQFNLKILLCAVASLLNSLGQFIPKKSLKT